MLYHSASSRHTLAARCIILFLPDTHSRLIFFYASDTDITIKVTDVFPNGTSMLVQDGIARLKWANSSTTPSLLQPHVIYSVMVSLNSELGVCERYPSCTHAHPTNRSMFGARLTSLMSAIACAWTCLRRITHGW